MRSSLFATALLVSLLVAGCTGPASLPTTGPEPQVAEPRVRLAAPTNITFAPVIELGTIQGGAEPSVAVGPDGVAYVVTPLSFWRSKDGGVNWEWVGTPVCPFGAPACPGLEEKEPGMRGGGDADLYVSPDNKLHWLGLADGDNAIPYQMSEDQGDTWTDVEDLAGEDGADREWITGRADGTLFAAWRNFPAEGDPKIVTRTSYDGGATWTPKVDIADDTRQGGIVVDPSSNALALAYDIGGVVSVARSFDDGQTWNSTVAIEDAAQGQVFPVAAYDENGTLYLIYSHDKDGSGAASTTTASRPMETPSVYMQVSHDKGLTFTEPVQVNAPGTTAWFPWIAAGSDGRIIVVWYQNDQGLPRQVGGNVYVMSGTSLDADFPAPTFALERVNPDPIHTGPECRETPGVCTRSLLDFFEVAIHPAGYPIIAWAQDTYQVPRDTIATSRMTAGPNLLG